MSVITSYNIESDTNMKEKLLQSGVATLGREYTYPKCEYDENGVAKRDVDGKLIVNHITAHYYDLDLSKMDEKLWAEDLKQMCDRGVRNFGTLSLKSEMVSYCNHQMDRPDFPSGEFLSHYAIVDDKIGYYVNRDIPGQVTGERYFVEFDEETANKIKDGAQTILDSWKQVTENGSTHYRRDYTDYEKKRMSVYPVSIDDDGKRIHWARNYSTAYDDNVGDYISRALPEDRLKFTIVTESDLDFEAYLLNGKNVKQLYPEKSDANKVKDMKKDDMISVRDDAVDGIEKQDMNEKGLGED